MKYDDIIFLTRPKSKYPKLSTKQRAAQFAPFAALTGYGDAIKETARITDTKIELGEDRKEKINNKIIYLINNIKNNISISITYFVKDPLKEGGKYIKEEATVKKIDIYNQNIILDNNTKIKIKDIIDIN